MFSFYLFDGAGAQKYSVCLASKRVASSDNARCRYNFKAEVPLGFRTFRWCGRPRSLPSSEPLCYKYQIPPKNNNRLSVFSIFSALEKKRKNKTSRGFRNHRFRIWSSRRHSHRFCNFMLISFVFTRIWCPSLQIWGLIGSYVDLVLL